MNLLPTKADFSDARIAPGTDLIAGLTVAVVALPLALAFGIASGLGAEAGITTAIIAGAIAAIFGGSKLQVSGPTGAMTVVLVPIFHQFGSGGVLLVGLIAGLLLLVTAFAKVGEHVHRLPTSLIEGFTAGIAVVIALQQFPFIFGVMPGEAEQVWRMALEAAVAGLTAGHFIPVIMTISVATAILLGSRRWHKIPFALVTIGVATIAADLANLEVDRIGELPARIGTLDFSFLNSGNYLALLPSAAAVASLAALESLLSAKVADKMRGGGEKHDANRELFGQGLANLVVPFFGGVPATAALARTAVNVRSGARSKLSALSHAFVLAAVVLLASSLVGRIPLAALAGVLIATTAHMIKPRELLKLARESYLDAMILVATFITTIFVDLISAVLLGLALSLILRKTKLAKVIDRRLPPIDEKETLGD
jgi:SulP family sulfate permease